MESFDAVKKYLKPGVGNIILGLALILLSAVSFVLLAQNDGGIQYIIIGAALAIVGIWLVALQISNLVKFNKECNEVAESAEASVIIREFTEPEFSPQPELRLGGTYIFAQKSGLLIKYDDIVNIYQYIHKTNGVEDGRELRAKTATRIVTLVKLKLRGKGDDMAARIVGFIMAKNPKITVGYNQ